MQSVKAGNRKSGAKTAAILLIISLLIIGLSYAVMGAPDIKYGDVNEDGIIDVNDVLLAMKYVLGLEDLTDDQLKAADVNGDGVVNVKDVTLIMQYRLNLIDKFPVETKIVSVEDVTIRVPFRTSYADIDFPENVEATLYDKSKVDVDVEWDDTSTPAYNPRMVGRYVFEGELVDLPESVTNPDDIVAKATVRVYLPWRPIPPPPPVLYTLSLEVDPEGAGTVDGDGTYEEGDEVEVSAEAEEGFEFANWTKDNVEISDEAEFTYTMPDEDVTLVANFEEITYTVTFEEENELEDVSIQVYSDSGLTEEVGDALTTDADGEAEIDLPDGDYWYTAELFGYEGHDGDFEVDGADKTVTFELVELDKYTVTFVEENGLEDVSIKVYTDANRTVEVASLSTDSIGEAEIDLPDGDYWYTAELFGYEDYDGDFAVDGADKIVEFELTESPFYTVTFAEENELEGVSIQVYSDQDRTEEVGAALTTDASGEAEIDLPDGDYWFAAELFEYRDYEGEFAVDGADRTVEFEMVWVFLVIVDIEEITGTVNVPFGTTEEEAIEALEDETEYEGVVEDEDNVTLDVVDWVAVDEYDGQEPGDYLFEGEAQAPEDYVFADDVDTTVQATVTVGEPVGAYFRPRIDAPDTVEPGDTLVVDWVITNLGNEEGTQEVTIEGILRGPDGEEKHQVDATGELTISAGEEYEWFTSDLDTSTGDWEAEVGDVFEFTLETEDEVATREVIVFDPGRPVHRFDADGVFVMDHTTIQFGVDFADTGHSLLVYPGTYEEEVTVDVEGLTIISVKVHEAIIDAGGAFIAVIIEADNVTVDGFEITNASNGMSVRPGYTGAVIQHNKLEDEGDMTAIFVNNGASVAIRENVIVDLKKGIDAETDEPVEIRENLIQETEVGVKVSQHNTSGNYEIVYNTFIDNDIHVYDPDQILDLDEVKENNFYMPESVVLPDRIVPGTEAEGVVYEGTSSMTAVDSGEGYADLTFEVKDYFGDPVTGLNQNALAFGPNENTTLQWFINHSDWDVTDFSYDGDGIYTCKLHHVNPPQTRTWDAWAHCVVMDEMVKIDAEIELEITGPGLPDSIEVLYQPTATRVGETITSDDNGFPAVIVKDASDIPLPGIEVEVRIPGVGLKQEVETDNEGIAVFDDVSHDESGTYSLRFLLVDDTNIEVFSEEFEIYDPILHAENSHAESEDNEDGSATITITLLDQYGIPYTEEVFGEDDIELHLYDDPDRSDIVWETLTEINNRPAYTTNLSEDNGVYTVEITCTAPWVAGKMDVEVDDELIEEGAIFELTNN